METYELRYECYSIVILSASKMLIFSASKKTCYSRKVSSPQGFDPLTNQRVPTLALFYDIHFRLTKPKFF